MKKVIYIMPIIFLLTFCHKETENIIGYDWLPYNSDIHTVKIYPDEGWQDAYFDCYVNCGFDERLIVGAWNGYRFRSLIYFDTDLLGIEHNAHITSAKIRLTFERETDVINDNIYNEGELVVVVSRVYQEWLEGEVTWDYRNHHDRWDGGRFGPPVSSMVVGDAPEDYEYVYVDITPMAIDWLTSPSTNFGAILYARYEDAESKIKEFYSLNEYEEDLIPRLIVNYEEGGMKYEASCPPMMDATIVKYDGELGENTSTGSDEHIYIGGFDGYSRRALFHFDVSEEKTGIPANATIVKAGLFLYFFPSSRGDVGHMSVFKLDSAFNEGDTVSKMRALSFNPEEDWGEFEIESESAGYKEVIINELMQKWVYGSEENLGLLIRGNYDVEDSKDILRFGTRENQNPDTRPYLEIRYAIPPD